MNSLAKTFNDALAALRQNRPSDAELLFKRCLKTQPANVAALNLLTITLMSLQRFAEAETYISRAVTIDRSSDVSFYNYGIILKQLKKPREALQQFNTAISLNPRTPESWNNRGTIFNELRQFDAALTDFSEAIRLNANYAEPYCNSGNSLSGLGHYSEALRAYQQAAALNPRLPEAALGIGSSLAKLKRYNEALAAYGNAAQLRPDWIELLLAQASVLTQLRRYDEAFAVYNQVVALKPDLADARVGLGNVYLAAKRHDEASSAFDEALRCDPASSNAWLGRSNLLFDLRRLDEALQAYEKALALQPDLPEAWLGRGNVLFDLKQSDLSLQAFDEALRLRPDLAEAWLGRGNILLELKRVDEAIAAYAKALDLKADLAEAWLGQGNALVRARHFEEAFIAFDRAVTHKADLPFARGLRLYCKLHLCDWSDLEEETRDLVASLKSGILACSPFPLLGISSEPSDQLLCTRLFNQNHVPWPARVRRTQRSHHARIRVAYLSADFCDHPTAYLLAGVIDHHDIEHFEPIAISFGPNSPSQMLDRLKGSFSKFIDVNDKSDEQVAELIRELEIDIAIDLMGYTANGRAGILSSRPSPIQVSYLGYPGTMGAEHIDYLIADQTVVPLASQSHYSEKIVYLPHSYQPNDSRRSLGEGAFTRDDMGLPQHGFVFCCFNDTYKITPEVFGCWMEILRQVEGSVLWLLECGSTSATRLKEHAQRAGISADRIVFAKRTTLPQHLARHALADLFLDTLPYNAHTTASDALWTSLPVLTRTGASFASRVAASLLTAIGLPELITGSSDDYTRRAIKLATDPGALAAIKRKLAGNRHTMPLFDTRLYTQHLEAAYATMCQRHREGLPPDHISVPRELGRE